MPLVHRQLTFNMIVPGPLILLRYTLFNCHNTISRWCSRPIKKDPLKKKKKKDAQKDAQGGFEPCISGWESATLLIALESRLYCNAVRLHLIPITTTLLSINYVTFLCIYVIMSWNRIENNAVFMFYDVKLRVKQLWKKTCCTISAPKNCRMARIGLVQHGNYCI